LTKAGWLAALIPHEYGGSGLGLAEASVIMEEIDRAGGNSGACHGQMQQENDQALAAINASGKTEIIVLDETQKAAWRKAMQPVYKDMEGRVGKELIASIQKAS
jgi:alkylation response protein AidB-like acyl-CoA dehydrogenase